MTEPIRPYPLITSAIRAGDWPATASLLQTYPEMRDFQVPAFGTWIHYACAHGTLEIVQGLAAGGFDVDSRRESEGCAPLQLAAASGKADVVRWLLDQGVSIDTSTAIRNPLFAAIQVRATDVVADLLAAGVDVTCRYRLGGAVQTVDAVAFAMLHNAREIARMIVQSEAGASADVEVILAEGLRTAHAVTTPVEANDR